MKVNTISILTAVTMAVVFCVFIMAYEQHALTMARSRINTHARIIEDAMWNYNHDGIYEYLKLAAFSDRYEALVINHHNGSLFQKIQTEPASRLDRFLIRIRLMPRVSLEAPVKHQDHVIGRMKAIWLPATIYIHAYVFFALVLVYVIMQLVLRLIRNNALLEKRVKLRTAELVTTNKDLKKEIEERIRVEEALRASEQRHRFLSENINDVIWTLDLEFNYTYISPAAARVHGWDEAYRKSLQADRALTPASYRKATRIFTDALARGERSGRYNQIVTTDLEVVHKNGSTSICEATASFIVDDDGRPTGLLGVTRDITERRRADAEKAELQRQLERSKKMESLGVLAGGVAHDLNNVLSGIVSYPDLLLMDLPADSPLRAPIETIKESGQKAATIVQDLLTLARRGVSASDVLNLNELIRNQRRSAEYRKLRLHHPDTHIAFELDENLPNIKGSAVHLNKTVMNLISNAAEAQPAGGKITVSTASHYMDRPIRGYDTIDAGEYVRLRIQDTGEGIDEADLNHIFEPFYTKKKMGRSGTGLGLAVVWGTVQDHNGYIDVVSRKEAGTVFDLYFPLTRDASEQEKPRVNLPEIRGRGERVLVVDDMESQRKIAVHLLERLNYTATSVENGEAAVDFLKENRVDLVILDMIMDPGMDGLETWRCIVESNPGQRAIIASGYAETDKVKQAQQLGAGEYLRKPYMLDSLGKAVIRALQGARN